MIPPPGDSGLPAFLWQVLLHSIVVGVVFYAWARQLRLPSGRAKRRLLGLVLVLPLVTAAVPGRSGPEFRARVAWLDSTRLLVIPLPAGLRLYHAVLGVAGLMVAVTVWQEIMPALRRPRPAGAPVPDGLEAAARALPGWERCQVVTTASAAIALATAGWPWNPVVLVARGALVWLTETELAAALRHEHAHWQARRWLATYALFLLRLVQCYNPVALWSFREYCLEIEIECDAAAVAGQDPRILAGALLKVYESTSRRDVGSRSALRKRVDVLLGRSAHDDHALPVASLVAASLILLGVLPWCV